MELLTPTEVKKILKCSLPWIYKAASTGVLPCVRIPCPEVEEKRKKDMVRFKQEDIFAFIEKHYRKR